jgi:hypothetical protein
MLIDAGVKIMGLRVWGRRHANGCWGEENEHDHKVNEYPVKHCLRVLFAHSISTSEKIWIITEADRSTTTILLPEEY